MRIRCVKNYIVTTTETIEIDGKMVINNHQYSLRCDSIYEVEEVEYDTDIDTVSIIFNSSMKGVGFNIPSNIFEIMGTAPTTPSTPCCSNRTSNNH